MRKIQKYAFVVASIFLVWYAAHAAIKPAQGGGRVIEDFREIPLYIGEWSGVEGEFDEVTRKGLPHCSLMTRDYENEEGYDSNLSIVYGVDLGDFHQPEYCMEGQGWRRISSRIVTVPSEKPHKAVIATMRNDDSQIIVLYWFASKDHTTTVLGGHKLTTMLGRLEKRELKPSAMVRLITPIQGDTDMSEKITLELAALVDPFINQVLAKPPVFSNTGESLLQE